MSDREALADALDTFDQMSSSPNTYANPILWGVITVLATAAQERLVQLPETCESPAHPDYACTACHSWGAPGKVYPQETVDLVARVLSDDDYDHGCDYTHHLDEATDVLKALNGKEW